MIGVKELQRPKTVRRAEYVLLAWAAWICLFGIYQSWKSIPEIEAMAVNELHGMMAFPSGSTLLMLALVGYVLIALTIVWLVLKIGQGKKWARSSLLFSVVVEVIWVFWPPYHGLLTYLPDIPDLGLQIYAVYLLYTWPGRTLFTRDEWACDAVNQQKNL